MTSPPTKAHGGARSPGLETLAAAARRDLERMLFPAPNWAPLSAGPALAFGRRLTYVMGGPPP